MSTLLAVETLTRRFGGLTAVDSVSVDLHRGEVHGVIGTNGAGKSTLINMLSGELPATSGRIELAGADITDWSQPRRARAGVGRSYQRTTIFPKLSVFENIRLCAQAARQRPWAVWQAAEHCAVSRSVAERALAAAGLADVSQLAAGLLSHGQQRQLEISMCLATQPRVLLLDEPLAGMGAEETELMLKLLVDLKRTHALLLVEHDMDAVFRVADLITVMVNGEVITSDVPEVIRSHADVRVAYLGEG
jgi:branched-chain amino acid transport system ATP-binding protein